MNAKQIAKQYKYMTRAINDADTAFNQGLITPKQYASKQAVINAVRKTVERAAIYYNTGEHV